MNQQQMEQLRNQLTAEHGDLMHRLDQNHEYGLELSLRDSTSELSTNDNHPADLGSEMFERGKDLALQDADQHHLEELNRALALMDYGQYGICEVCHQEIPFERMEALPWTTTCKEHHPDPHSSERRPIEEEALGSPTHSFKDDSDYNGYDGEDAWQELEKYGTATEVITDDQEQRGYVDLTEGFIITDISGDRREYPEITHNAAYRKKESEEQ